MGYGGMVTCNGCGFNVEKEDVVEFTEYSDGREADRCKKCDANPDLREARRRGWNDGIDALARSVQSIVSSSNLRKHPEPPRETAQKEDDRE